ncbi:hypothetical protein IG631_12787 [Alternaria alternata]|nr:hypothetical protein IG631_12787 [Alternaria alternata]
MSPLRRPRRTSSLRMKGFLFMSIRRLAASVRAQPCTTTPCNQKECPRAVLPAGSARNLIKRYVTQLGKDATVEGLASSLVADACASRISHHCVFHGKSTCHHTRRAVDPEISYRWIARYFIVQVRATNISGA